MAASQRSPGLKDEWRATQEHQDKSAFVRGRFSEHERGKNRHRVRRRPSGPDRRSRSPVSSRFGQPSGYEDSLGQFESSSIPSASRRPSFSSSQSLPVSRDGPRAQEANDVSSEKSYGRGGADREAFSQTRRGRSPRGPRRDRNRKNRNAGNHQRGQSSQQRRPSRRERYQERNSRARPFPSGGFDQLENNPKSRSSLSPARPDTVLGSASQRSNSPGFSYEDRNKSGRSPSISSNLKGETSTYKHRPATAEPRDSPSMSRPTSSSNAEARNDPSGNNNASESFSRHGTMNTTQDFDMRDAPTGPRADRQHASQYGSYHGGSEPNSPYPNSRGGRNKHMGNDQDSYQHDTNHAPSNMPPARGGYHRGFQDRRFSGHGPSGFNGSSSQRGRGHFNSHQWIPTGPRDRGEQNNSPNFHHSGSNTPQYQASQSNDQPPAASHHDDNSRFLGDVNMEHVQAKPSADLGDAQTMPPPPREPASSTTPAKEGSKFSFAFKSKANPPPPAKPVPDLAQRMQVREPPRGPAMRPPEQPSRNRMSGPPPPPKFKQDHRRDRDRDTHRGRGRDDRRDLHPRNPRDSRREDHRFDPRDARHRDDQRPDFRHDRRRDRSPEPKRQKRTVQRVRPRQILPEEFRDSDSVYYRKPGDESVIGAGTYGKVFKAIHIYTQDKVALKRIRMEGEKDGFPVTAVREIKLLQHLRHNNVVSLLEVMVERNECFMVFEYLSHDLTGLINHPTFTLTEAHKKDLAKQMFGGLQYLHHRGVLHRDIKAANILISNRGQLKYADFGLARFFSKSRQLDYTNRVITIWYRPPELLLGDTRYGPAVDIWSAACVFMEMFTKKAVFPGDGKELNQLDKLYSSLGTPTRADWPGIVDMPWVELMGPTERKKRVFEDTYRDFLSPSALDLMCQIFQYDPAKRPTADEVLAHAYFTAEEPGPQQATELENIEGDWHEFESKALRKERDREAREARKDREREREKEKRRASTGLPQETQRDAKRQRQEEDSA
ncbi:protein kinase, putative [Talaromyces stipitatus ATCC 10500]|uniref:cyclin-dependent kinase n=1 Tax=Talaromyces stipitatus (strain ATCC 10500 / CBS 375.48 / QM 6759 / NRRL 1006) TaxID=441959 RepID=B8MDE8_TALSN|nr:protein kinase, putative [Talaromyces stipitatus ATCC 10500]EED17911.1 protein kinase, putative [Talaromyces stipitatus ATCC 10500]